MVVAEGGAKGSTRCLRFNDAKGKPTWKPHMWNHLRIEKGRVRFSFHIKNDKKKPARILISFRDWRRGLRTGPSVELNRDIVKVRGKSCGSIPLGTWGKIEIAFELGERAPKYYKLKVATADMMTPTDRLPFESEDFRVATWYGFVSASNEEAIWWLDRVKLDVE
jgi:hypothetical protein